MNIPYKCPVCMGKGVVPPGFYDAPSTGVTNVSTSEACKACGGKGVLWGFDFTQPIQPYVQPTQPPWQPYYPPTWPYGGGTICRSY